MTVEDGTGKTDADSFCDLAYANTYLAARNSAWAGKTDTEKETALVVATEYINDLFQWKGTRSTADQSLSFPRINLTDNDGYAITGVPSKIKQSVCLAASEFINGESLFATDDENGAIVSESVSGAVSTTYDVTKKKEQATRFQAINEKLRGLYVDMNRQRIVTSRVIK